MIDYIDFDDKGIAEVRCMICNTPVKVRTIQPITGKTILRTLSNYREVNLALEDENGDPHSTANIVSCVECQYDDFDFGDMMNTIRKGWEKSLKAQKRQQKDIDKYLKTFEKVKINKKLRKNEKAEKKQDKRKVK